MLIKRPIYNQTLQCVANEILIDQNVNVDDRFKHNLYTVINSTDSHLPLFLPYTLQSLIEHSGSEIENPIILKLQAHDIDTIYSHEELESNAYSIALFINDSKQFALLNYADYIALNETLIQSTDIAKMIKHCQTKLRKVIGYDISTPKVFDQCKSLNLDFYCGQFLLIPHSHGKGEIAANKLNLLKLINLLHQEDIEFDELAGLIQADPLMSYQLLRLVNSVTFSGFEPIDSIQQAVVRLGIFNLRNWVMVLSMRNVSNKPIEIVESGLIRAYMAQELTKENSQISSLSAYTAGLLSVLDSLLDIPMEILIDKITLADEIKAALVAREGPLGALLNVVITYETGNWNLLPGNASYQLDLCQVYLDCLKQVSLGKSVIYNKVS